MKYNACINILSSRTKCLPLCLRSLWDNWNYRYDYPVYVHYFDDIYDNPKIRQAISEFSKSKVEFIQVPYETPKNLKEEELFYNRTDLWYVNTGRFTKSRKGYLHMCHFYNNLYKYPNTKLHEYDWFFNIDDEAKFLKEVPYNFFEVVDKSPHQAGVIKMTYPWVKKAHQGVKDSRVGMKDFVIDYVEKYNIKTKSEFINELMKQRTEEYFHENLIMGDSWVFKVSTFETEEWKQWSKELNLSNGIYKYRWGDTEMNALFFMIHYGELPLDLKTVDEGYHDQGGYRHIQGYAPSIKDTEK